MRIAFQLLPRRPRSFLALNSIRIGGENMAMSRSTLALMAGDPGVLGALMGLGSRIAGGIIRKTAPIVPVGRAGTVLARIAGGARGALTKTAAVLGPAGTAVLGGAAAGVAGGMIAGRPSAAAGAALAGGFQVIKMGRTGRPLRILTADGRVVNLVRRHRGISASAISAAFRLARLAHAFGGAMRTGRRPHHRKRA